MYTRTEQLTQLADIQMPMNPAPTADLEMIQAHQNGSQPLAFQVGQEKGDTVVVDLLLCLFNGLRVHLQAISKG